MRRVLTIIFAALVAVSAASADQLLLKSENTLLAGKNSGPVWSTVVGHALKRIEVRVASVDFTPAIEVQIGNQEPAIREGKGGAVSASFLLTEDTTVRIGVSVSTGSAELGFGSGGNCTLKVIEHDAEQPLALGASRESALRSGDLVGDDDRYYDRYLLPVKNGERIVVSMGGEKLDTYLKLVLPDGRTLENDDSAGGNAIVRFTALSAGNAVIEAASYGSEETGTYTISAEALAKPVQIEVGMPVQGTLSDADQMIANEPQDSFLLSGKAGENVVINLQSTDFDPSLQVEDQDGVLQENDDIGDNNLNSQLEYQFKADGTLLLFVWGVDKDSRGSYELSVTGAPAKDN